MIVKQVINPKMKFQHSKAKLEHTQTLTNKATINNSAQLLIFKLNPRTNQLK